MYKKEIIDFKSDLYDKHATLYADFKTPTKACVLYLHGGGILFGHREDLPEAHLRSFTEAGYPVLALDYPLAPAAKLPEVFSDIESSVNEFIERRTELFGSEIPYVLWGRSSGAYLSLLVGSKGKFNQTPAAILSYYGYGFLCEGWFMEGSKYYNSLPIKASYDPSRETGEIHADGGLDTHYMTYVYARQTGEWKNMIYEGRDKFFYRDYTLRLVDQMPCPLFAAHSTGDTDVPYREFLALCEKYPAKRFVATCDTHDFDREETSFFTTQLLEGTIQFLDDRLK